MLRPVLSKNLSVQVSRSIPGMVPQAQTQPISTTAEKLDSFKVQDPKDFNERVKNSKVPVIVDFFAT